ncbi:MAG: hypothetical protein JXA42_07930, partial [Anaerolineales bacterium]|nr:hypothetical protein [Anaerolineales bacterium]
MKWMTLKLSWSKPIGFVPALTGIRTIAAGMIFFYHWFFNEATSLPLLIRAPFNVGYVAVPIFFS